MIRAGSWSFTASDILCDGVNAARVSDGVIDSIMRHKPVGVGKRFYRHVHEFERREAIERLPDYPWPGDLVEAGQKAKKAVS